MRPSALVLAFSLAACGASVEELPARPAARSDLPQVACERPAAPPAEGTRRYEFRVETAPGMAWLNVDGKQLYKDQQHPEGCFYLDLPAGDHHVTFRAAAEQPLGAVGAALRVAELNPKGPWWIDVFRFQCGDPSACDKETLVGWKRDVEQDHRKLTDPCGAVKVRALAWRAGRLPDGQHPDDLELRFTMHMYQKAWDKPPGAQDCPER